MTEEGFEKVTSIILAENDPDDAAMFQDSLNLIDANTNLTVVESSDELFSLLESNAIKPHLIFLDLNMPGKDGITCLKELREHPNYRHYVIIIYSTSSYLNDINDSYEAGANLYVIKPFSYSDVKKTLQEILKIEFRKVPFIPPRDKFVMYPFLK